MTVYQSKDSSSSNHIEKNNLQRFFPPIQADIYKSSYNLSEVNPDRKVALKILNLANKKLNKFETLLSWNLDAQEKLGRFLHQHSLAIKTELEGEWKQAGFYWTQVSSEIEQLAKQDDLWLTLVKELASEPGVVVMKDPVKMRQRLVKELLIDTHYNFYHSIDQQSAKLEIKEQAFVHIKYIEDIVELSSVSGDDLLAILDYPWQKQINLYQEAEKWHEAFFVCQDRLKLFPDSVKFQNELVTMKTKAALATLTSKAHKSFKDLLDFKQDIRYLNNLLEKYPDNLIIYHSLAVLHCKLSLCLTGNRQIDQALLNVEKALTYNPECIEAHRIQKQLTRQIPRGSSSELKLQEKFKASSKSQKIKDGLALAKEKHSAWQKLQTNQNVVYIPEALQSNPVFQPTLNLDNPKNEPFLRWIFSFQDMKVKILAIFSSIFLLSSGGFLFREIYANSVRNRTYFVILEADKDRAYPKNIENVDKEQIDLKIIENAEDFLNHSSFKGKDVREGDVRRLYSQAFVQWITNKGEELNNNDWNIII